MLVGVVSVRQDTFVKASTESVSTKANVLNLKRMSATAVVATTAVNADK